MKLKDMRRSKAQMKKARAGDIVSMDEEKYPYGLRITLNEDSMKKLGISLEDVKFKDSVDIVAEGHICNMSMHEGEYGGSKDIGIQITHLDVKPARKKRANKSVSELKRFMKLSDK